MIKVVITPYGGQSMEIHQGSLAIFEGLPIHQVNDGKQSSVWKHNWLGNYSLQQIFPRHIQLGELSGAST